MKLIRPSFKIIDQEAGLDGIFKQIELAGRTCYKSFEKIHEGSAFKFVSNIINSGHNSVLEHGTVYLQLPLKEFNDDSRIKIEHGRLHARFVEDVAFVTTNYRYLLEHGALDMLEYLCDRPSPMHKKRVTVMFCTQIAISREFNRHRVNSPSEESTRYCNYSKDKFGNEISINLPTWVDFDDATNPRFILEERLKHCAENFGEELWDAIDYWLFANAVCEYCYLKLIEKGRTAEEARTILPLDTNTELVHTAFVSDWRHFFELRAENKFGKPHSDAKILAQPLKREFVKRGYLFDD